jgi:hypothetical protein
VLLVDPLLDVCKSVCKRTRNVQQVCKRTRNVQRRYVKGHAMCSDAIRRRSDPC